MKQDDEIILFLAALRKFGLYSEWFLAEHRSVKAFRPSCFVILVYIDIEPIIWGTGIGLAQPTRSHESGSILHCCGHANP